MNKFVQQKFNFKIKYIELLENRIELIRKFVGGVQKIVSARIAREASPFDSERVTRWTVVTFLSYHSWQTLTLASKGVAGRTNRVSSIASTS